MDNLNNNSSSVSNVKKVVETDKYIRLEFVGAGGYKKVYKAYDREDGYEVAWNQIKVGPKVDMSKLKSEINMLQRISHENIIQCYDFWIDTKDLKCIFITEYMTSGDLRKFLQIAGVVSRDALKSYCKQILSGLDYLHSQDPPIIHRDIKLDNIFFTGADRTVKIGDLGLATILEESRKAPLSVIGTANFMAPETFQNFYDQLVDIWAFGMCVIEMATLDYPYCECTNVGAVYKKVLANELPRSLGKIIDIDALAFVLHCLAPAEERYSTKELLQHVFLKRIVSEDGRPIRIRKDDESIDRIMLAIADSPDDFIFEGDNILVKSSISSKNSQSAQSSYSSKNSNASSSDEGSELRKSPGIYISSPSDDTDETVPSLLGESYQATAVMFDDIPSDTESSYDYSIEVESDSSSLSMEHLSRSQVLEIPHRHSLSMSSFEYLGESDSEDEVIDDLIYLHGRSNSIVAKSPRKKTPRKKSPRKRTPRKSVSKRPKFSTIIDEEPDDAKSEFEGDHPSNSELESQHVSTAGSEQDSVAGILAQSVESAKGSMEDPTFQKLATQWLDSFKSSKE
eukprot:TRINITY_DN9816_c0_g1_i1.p1 TRINITY_DN9816_c0_g1~~TRINITY_DN9816_c0_g1_i1.p1  ORF type:complete len:593 (-),score=135.10 TRINITY_DN9816_c0_g1_i1:60-1763(-)